MWSFRVRDQITAVAAQDALSHCSGLGLTQHPSPPEVAPTHCAIAGTPKMFLKRWKDNQRLGSPQLSDSRREPTPRLCGSVPFLWRPPHRGGRPFQAPILSSFPILHFYT